LVSVWVAASVGFGMLLAVASARGPLDDPDPARQRSGFLISGATIAPAVTHGVPIPGRRAIVFFERPGEIGPLCQALRANDLGGKASLAVIVSSQVDCPSQATLVVDNGGLAIRFGMPTPVDGGPPVGYALIDSAGRIRYRTLDPRGAAGLDEVDTMLADVG